MKQIKIQSTNNLHTVSFTDRSALVEALEMLFPGWEIDPPIKTDTNFSDFIKNRKPMEITTVSKKGLDFLANEEGLILKPYKDSVGIPTIGIGSTYYEDGTRVKMTDKPITKKRALELFANVLKNYELGVYSVTRDDINQNQFDALVSLCFNIGVHAFKNSTVLRLVNANPKDPKITAAFKMWKRAGNHPNILLNRRIREAKLYFS